MITGIEKWRGAWTWQWPSIVVLAGVAACHDAVTGAERSSTLLPGAVLDPASISASAYTYEELSAPPGYATARAINAVGVIGGAIGNQPALWIADQPTVLTLPPGFTQGLVLDVNDVGTAVGIAFATTGLIRGFYWKAGTFTFIQHPTAIANIQLLKVNNHDESVGWFQDVTKPAETRAFRYHARTGLIDLQPAGTSGSRAGGINDAGVVVGQYVVGFEAHLARWPVSNHLDDLGTIPGLDVSLVTDVNASGTIVGYAQDEHAPLQVPFAWREPRGGAWAPVNGQAYAVSDRGRIVGMRNEVRRIVAATRFPGQPFELLPVPASPPYSYAWAVDRCGTIVGEITDGHNTRAVRWRNATCD